jgi:hypothetical protein
MQAEATVLNTPEQIALYRLAALRAAVKLEIRGLKASRGRRATVIAREILGLPKSTRKAEVLAAIEETLEFMVR